MQRREFLTTTALAAALGPRLSFAQDDTALRQDGQAPAADRVQVAVLGCGRGRSLAHAFSQLKDCDVAVICDVDEGRGQQLCQQLAEKGSRKPQFAADFRRLLDRQDIDALIVATPDHWHAPITILGCAAGKDVYVEKPASHNVREGRLAIQAARKFERIVQHGTQLRAAPHYTEAWQLLKDGVIGKVLVAKAINNQRRGRVNPQPDAAVPAGVNYDLWLGPAQKRPFNPTRFHSTWHWQWDYGTGDIGNDGVHQIDLARWALNLGAPNAVSCSAAKLGSKGDAQQTPDTMNVTWEYSDLLLIYEQRDFTPYRLDGHRLDNDNIFFGDQGYMIVDRDGYRVQLAKDRGPQYRRTWTDQGQHYRNFVDCIKSRNHKNLIADIEEGHLSSLLCHLGNIAYRTGQRLEFDAKSETFANAPQADALLGRDYRAGFELPVLET